MSQAGSGPAEPESQAALQLRLETENCLGPSGPVQTLTLAGANFCIHGKECCPVCSCDHRLLNNANLGVASLDPGGERQPISNTDSLSYIVRQDGKTVECSDHLTVGCRLCFNYEKVLKRQLLTSPRPRAA